MTRVILACLLALTLTTIAQAKSGDPKQTKTARGLVREASAPTMARPAGIEAAPQQSDFETGHLRLLDGHRLPVPGLRYHASQHLVEVQDSVQPDSTHFWPLTSLRGFDVGADSLPPSPAANPGGPVGPAGPRRFRTRLVHEDHRNPGYEVVEILTCADAAPLVLGWLPAAGDGPRQVVAGAGTDRTEPLRPLELTRTAVLRLFGARAVQVRAFAMTYDLHFEQATDVARMFDYFNRLAVAKQ